MKKQLIIVSVVMSYMVNATELSKNSQKNSADGALVPGIYLLKESDPSFICLVVPEYSKMPSKNKEAVASLRQFVDAMELPQDFFSLGIPTQKTKPLCCYFDWQEQENSKARKEAGLNLAKSISALRKKYKKSTLVVIAMGHGGNVVQAASQKIDEPLDVLIELAPPLLTACAGKEAATSMKNSDDFSMKQAMIGRIFTFYTEKDFVFEHPALHPRYIHYHEQSLHPLLSNILLLINNKHPVPLEMMGATVGKRLLLLCKKIQQTYKHHNHLIAHISTVKPEVDLVVVLRSNQLYPGVEHGLQKVAQERVLSTVYSNRFKKIWGRSLTASPSFAEKQHAHFKGFKSFFNASLC